MQYDRSQNKTNTSVHHHTVTQTYRHPLKSLMNDHPYNLFKAFFLFSAFVEVFPVAALLTAFVVPIGTALFVILSPILVVGSTFPPTFASAVARGKGEGRHSFSFPVPSFPTARGALRGYGRADEVDLCMMPGVDIREDEERKVDDEEVFAPEVALRAEIAVVEGTDLEDEAATEEDDSAGAGSSNSTGLTRGVACTLVINLARLQ